MGPRPDALFAEIVRLQGGTPWGSVFDAETGRHSLSFVKSRAHDALDRRHPRDPSPRSSRARTGSPRRRELDRSVVAGRRSFDTVLVDYVVGALDGFAPYFQDAFFARLRPHCRGRVYVIGLEPYGEYTTRAAPSLRGNSRASATRASCSPATAATASTRARG